MSFTIEMLQASQGKIPAKLVLKNAKVLNVFSSEWICEDVALWDDTIIGTGSYQGLEELDLTGKYLVPGLIDAHVHIESSMLTPGRFAAEIVTSGTTTIIADPHEIANVAGEKGMAWFLEEMKKLTVNGYVMLPSCVPATSFDDSGARLSADALLKLKNEPAVLGLGEMMDYAGVMDGEPEVLKKLRGFSDKIIDGHAPMLLGKELQAYLLAGVATNHECSSPEEALGQLRSGMFLMVRRGSAAKNGEALLCTLLDSHVDLDRVCFCTDDKHVGDIRKEGHISANIREAISLGMDPANAYRMASYNAARMYGLSHLGAIGAGYQADLVILDDLTAVTVSAVYCKGKRLENRAAAEKPEIPPELLDTVHVKDVILSDFNLKVTGKEAPVIEVIPNQINTKLTKCPVPLKKGYFVPDGTFRKAAVIERHHGTGRIGLGIIRGLPIRGAVASTVSHDSHNLIVVGDNDCDMLLAAKRLTALGGGYCLIRDTVVLAEVPLPICGLLSDRDGDAVEEAVQRMTALCRKMGLGEYIDPFLTLSFLSLPVIPEGRVTDRGVFDSVGFTYVSF